MQPDFLELDSATQLRLLHEGLEARPEWLRSDLAPDVLVTLLQHLPGPLGDHPSASVRAAAARYAENPAELMARESDPGVQAALLAHLHDAETVCSFLSSPDWRVRAAAGRAAVRLELREPLRSLALLSRHKDTKAACVQALTDLGDSAWLAEHYL